MDLTPIITMSTFYNFCETLIGFIKTYTMEYNFRNFLKIEIEIVEHQSSLTSLSRMPYPDREFVL